MRHHFFLHCLYYLFSGLIISGCGYEVLPDNKNFRYELEGENNFSSHEAFLRKNSPIESDIKVVFGESVFRTDKVLFTSSGATTGVNLSLKIPVKIYINNEISFDDFIKSNTYLTKINNNIAEEASLNQAKSKLYESILLSIDNIIYSLRN